MNTSLIGKRLRVWRTACAPTPADPAGACYLTGVVVAVYTQHVNVDLYAVIQLDNGLLLRAPVAGAEVVEGA